MPVIALVFGIVIRMYFDDHAPPHFHASYQGLEACVRIGDTEVTQGALPRKVERFVHWAHDHRGELIANSQRGVDLQPLEMIAGADLDD